MARDLCWLGLCVRACMRACVCVCVRVCVRVCERACVLFFSIWPVTLVEPKGVKLTCRNKRQILCGY